MPKTGEQIQAQGADGLARAKRWLDATCRATVVWNNPDVGVHKLQYRKAGAAVDSDLQGDFFSFDLGGYLLGGDANGHMFVGEVKMYTTAQNHQSTEYQEFLAKCYRAESDTPRMWEHYLWITWMPFLGTRWPDLVTEPYVSDAVQAGDDHKYIALGDAPFDPAIAKTVGEKLMLVVLGDRQEEFLSLHGNELVGVQQALIDLRKP